MDATRVKEDCFMKLTPVDISGLADRTEIIDKCHDVFKSTIGSKEKRPMLGEMEIFVPFEWIENKAEVFWHIGSIAEKENLKIFPCTNDISLAKCDSNCVTGTDFIVLKNGEVRNKCVYRASRVGWIVPIIEMYNSNDSRVVYWEKLNKEGRKRAYLRYREDEIDYLVVFEKKSDKKVRFITGYPLFFIDSKKESDKDYVKYIKECGERKN